MLPHDTSSDDARHIRLSDLFRAESEAAYTREIDRLNEAANTREINRLNESAARYDLRHSELDGAAAALARHSLEESKAIMARATEGFAGRAAAELEAMKSVDHERLAMMEAAIQPSRQALEWERREIERTQAMLANLVPHCPEPYHIPMPVLPPPPPDLTPEVQRLRRKAKDLRRNLEQAAAENAALKAQNEAQRREIIELKKRERFREIGYTVDTADIDGYGEIIDDNRYYPLTVGREWRIVGTGKL